MAFPVRTKLICFGDCVEVPFSLPPPSPTLGQDVGISSWDSSAFPFPKVCCLSAMFLSIGQSTQCSLEVGLL